MIIKKDYEIVKAKDVKKSLALKAKKESSDEECLTSGKCPKPPKDKNQRAFVRGSWSDSGEEDDEKVKNETCLIAQASSEWEHPPLAVGTYTASGNSLLAVGMPCAFYSQHYQNLELDFQNQTLDQKLHHLEEIDLEPDEWIKDSECSKHMTDNRKLFSIYKAYNGGNVIFGSNHRGNIIGKGHICDNKCRVTFFEHDSEITKDGKVIGRGIRKKGLYVMKLKNKPKDQICLATIDENSTLWHIRLGHANMHLIQSFSSKELVRNLPKIKFDQHFCDACKIEKQAHASHKAKNIVSMTRCLELLHIDLFGPFAVRSYGGNCYTLVIVDDYSRYTWTRFLKDKTEAFDQFEIFSKKNQNQLGCTIVSIRTDHGRKFINEVQFREFCNANGITHNFSTSRNPQSNGVVERKNRSLQEMSRTMLNEQSLPQNFWCNVVDTSTYILNRILIRVILGKTPYKVDDDLDEEEAIKVTEKKNLEKDIEDETLEIDEIVNIKESRNHPLENVIGSLNQRTLRLVAQGYNQQEGIDYDETYTPVARIESIRILLAYACALDFKVFQMDVKSAILNDLINEEVYVAQPPGFIDFEKPDHVYKLKKALYGLKQPPKACKSSRDYSRKHRRAILEPWRQSHNLSPSPPSPPPNRTPPTSPITKNYLSSPSLAHNPTQNQIAHEIHHLFNIFEINLQQAIEATNPSPPTSPSFERILGILEMKGLKQLLPCPITLLFLWGLPFSPRTCLPPPRRKHLNGYPQRDYTFQSISGSGYPFLGHALFRHPSRIFGRCFAKCRGTPVMSLGFHANMSKLRLSNPYNAFQPSPVRVEPIGCASGLETIVHSNGTILLLRRESIPPGTRNFNIP
uniref:Retrotransposon protein n=1 Tax=Tanacetum cinerariifolium TaxID=118510 RepID=A0A6L2J9L3_TANCI|nr:retrotransposon protein [Tanacetum cinerariifolium]